MYQPIGVGIEGIHVMGIMFAMWYVSIGYPCSCHILV